MDALTPLISQALPPHVLQSGHGNRQVLVIDRLFGPAETLTEILGRLFEDQISYIVANNHVDVSYAVYCYKPSLIIVGLETEAAEPDRALIAALHKAYPAIPMIAVAKCLCLLDLEKFRTCGFRDIIELPQRAAALKTLVVSLAQRYLS
jgi:hypothetical protein